MQNILQCIIILIILETLKNSINKSYNFKVQKIVRNDWYINDYCKRVKIFIHLMVKLFYLKTNEVYFVHNYIYIFASKEFLYGKFIQQMNM